MAHSLSNAGEAVSPKHTPGMTPKSVTIAPPEDNTSYFDLGEPAIGVAGATKPRRASKRLTGRPASRASFEQLPRLSSLSLASGSRDGDTSSHMSNEHHVNAHHKLHGAVTAWLHGERTKWQSRVQPHEKSYMQLAFESLEKILSEHPVPKHQRPIFPGPKRVSSSRKSRHASLVAQPSDTEFSGDDPIVPTTDEVLDNSRTVGISGAKEAEAWLLFKNEIIKLAHTLRLKGWRRVSLDAGNDIEVTRLSGALTNAVYVVIPPKNIAATTTKENDSYVSKRMPVKLLLRVYGPQASHLIDREKELEILKRLARKRIGPRMLGTFLNGRFEEFFHAKTLTASDLREPETSKQIAKRMRELHDGIDLIKEERAAGPFVWQNWDKWVTRCEEVITWLDKQILSYNGAPKSKTEAWKTRGFVCGVQWFEFRKAVDVYRAWLKEKYGGGEGLRASLVFAHNDTQYGNILRIEPAGESPLLLPSNEHKQLVVIDFEYANANTPGLEFANHFTEWCYNYHADDSWRCNTDLYPSPEEQARFVKAYVQHHPRFQPPATTGSGSAAEVSSSSLATFMLDARVPNNYSYAEEEKSRDAKVNKEVQRLMDEARLWRIANSAQWVAWGIVQAKIAGMEEALEAIRKAKDTISSTSDNHHSPITDRPTDQNSTTTIDSDLRNLQQREATIKQEESSMPTVPHEHEIDDEEGFDYLAYAQDRAFFFWGDLIEMGLVSEGDLPGNVLERVKRLKF